MLSNENLISKDDTLSDMGCEFSFSAKSIDSIVSSIISFGKNVKPSVAICVVSRFVCSLKGRALGSSTVPNRLILTIPCS